MKQNKRRLALLGALMVMLVAVAFGQTVKVDPAISAYSPTSGVSGQLDSIGSDTLNNLMTLWSEGFRRVYPNVVVQVEGKGSSTAPPALAEGIAQLGPMSRPMKAEELEAFEARFGFQPTPIAVALDALAVYVHKDNPVEGLSLAQVDAIFSKTFNGGLSPISTWGQVGLGGSWGNLPISLYGRNSASGTYGFFKTVALFKGDFNNRVKEQPGSASVVLGITEDRSGIGYSGIGYRTSGVAMVPLRRGESGPYYDPSYENVLSGNYPLGRLLLVYVAKAPGEPLEPVVEEFLRFVLSREGQEVVVKDGYLPLPSAIVEQQLQLLEQ